MAEQWVRYGKTSEQTTRYTLVRSVHNKSYHSWWSHHSLFRTLHMYLPGPSRGSRYARSLLAHYSLTSSTCLGVLNVSSMTKKMQRIIISSWHYCKLGYQQMGELPENTISRNYKFENRRFLLCAKRTHAAIVSLYYEVSQSIMVASMQGIVVKIFLCKKCDLLLRSLCSNNEILNL